MKAFMIFIMCLTLALIFQMMTGKECLLKFWYKYTLRLMVRSGNADLLFLNITLFVCPLDGYLTSNFKCSVINVSRYARIIVHT